MSLDTALFLVDRGGQKFKASGSSIADTIKYRDYVLVQRNGVIKKAKYDNGWTYSIRDSDILLAWDGDANYQVSGADFLLLFGSGPEVIYWRHTLPSNHTHCPNRSKTFNLQWKIGDDNTCIVYGPGHVILNSGSVTEGDIPYTATTVGLHQFTLQVHGSNGVVSRHTLNVTTKCDRPTNSLTGAGKANYGQTYHVEYTQYNYESGQVDGTPVTNPSGYVYLTKYPTKDATYCSQIKSTNCCGTTTSTAWCVPVTGYSIKPTSLNGVPSNIKKKDEFYVNPSYSNTSKLKNVSYEWELEAGKDSGFANFNGNAAGRPGLFKSTVREPKIYCINNTHSKQDVAVNNPPGYLPNGVKLTLTITNDDNNESSTHTQYFKIYPQF